jgi:hypothetical protein
LGSATIVAIRTSWHDADHTVLIWTIENTWSWDEFNRQMLAAHQEAQALNHRYDVICDLTHCKLLPSGIVARAHLAVKYAPTNLGMMVVVGIPPIFDASLRAIRRVHPRLAGDLHTAACLPDALVLIERLRTVPTRADALFTTASHRLDLRKVTGLLKAVC